jgi:hypothetical protein
MRSTLSTARPQWRSRMHVRPSYVGAGLTAAALAAAALQHHYNVSVDPTLLAGGVPLLLSNKVNFARRYEQLSDMMKSDSDQPESQPWVLFDTQQYAQAGPATGVLSFFNSTAANLSDPTLSNFATGKLDAEYYFELHRVFTWIHSVPNTNATTAVTGAANDVEILHKTARGILNASMKGKPYFGFPLFFFGRPGGPVPFYAAYGTGTAANNTISAGETAENGGFPVLGTIIIPPAIQWLTNLQFVASTAISANTNISVGLMGILHRPVV